LLPFRKGGAVFRAAPPAFPPRPLTAEPAAIRSQVWIGPVILATVWRDNLTFS